MANAPGGANGTEDRPTMMHEAQISVAGDGGQATEPDAERDGDGAHGNLNSWLGG
jgi:hypothetical protein